VKFSETEFATTNYHSN